MDVRLRWPLSIGENILPVAVKINGGGVGHVQSQFLFFFKYPFSVIGQTRHPHTHLDKNWESPALSRVDGESLAGNEFSGACDVPR